MRITCPHCDTKLKVAERPDDDEVIKCPKCKKPFVLGASEDDEDEDRPVRRREDAEDDDRPVKRKRRDDDDDDEDDDDRPKKKKKGGMKVPLPAAIGVGVAVLAVVVVLVVLATGGDKTKKEVVDDGPTYVPPPPPSAPSELKRAVADLFREAADPTAGAGPMLPTLEAVGADPVVPSFSTLKARDPGPTAPPKLDENKIREQAEKSTAFIKVMSGLGGGSGSGFVIRAEGTTALVATNHHVIAPAVQSAGAAGSATGVRLTVVFDSGIPATEQELPATVIAHDAEADLAILRVPGVKRMPPILDPLAAPTPVPTMPVLVCGFPLGSMAAGGNNPNITVGVGHVSSIQTNRAGGIDELKLDAVLNPGNSGGPIVERATGRLVGVAVKTIRPGIGQGIGWAVPVPKLIAMIDGRVHSPAFTGSPAEGKEAPFQVEVPIADPFGRVKGVSLYIRPAGAPAGVKDPATGWKPMAGATKIDLKIEDGKATGQIRLPFTADKSLVGVQLACTSAEGVVAVSPPVTFTLTREGTRSYGDSVAVSALSRNPGKYTGKTVLARGKMLPTPGPMFDVFELNVVSETDGYVRGLQFLTGKEIGDQLNELPTLPVALPVQLVCKVGKVVNGRTLIRVSRVEIMGKGNKPALTIPSDTLEKLDQSIALNRSPEKFTGQTLTLNVLVGGQAQTRGGVSELVVSFLATRRPAENLAFQLPQALAAQWADDGPGEVTQATLTVRVEGRKGADGRHVVTVQKIEAIVNGMKKTFE